MSPILELIDVSKRYGGVRALEKAQFACAPGRIHALLGENGAGKSTLIKIMAGVVQPDEGRIVLAGQERRFAHPQDAVGAVAHADAVQHFLRAPRGLGPRVAAEAGHEADELAAGQVLVERVHVRAVADESPRAPVPRVDPGDAHAAERRPQLPVRHAQERRLPGPVRADEPRDPARQRERHLVQC